MALTSQLLGACYNLIKRQNTDCPIKNVTSSNKTYKKNKI